jgi:hypothetical protein
MRSRTRLSLLLLLALVASLAAVPAAAHPEHGQTSEDGPSVDGHHKQHDGEGGHLPASSRNIDLVGKLDSLTSVPGGIADVAAFGNTAYLAAFHPECAGRNPGSQGTGVHVVDIANPAAPTKIGFLPAEANSYVGEGVHVIGFEGRSILLHNNETCDAGQHATSGFAVWDVTNPRAARKIGQYGDTTPAVANQTFHTTHSVQGFVWQGKAYAVAQDNQDLADIDIFDLTPAIRGTGPAVLVWEGGLEQFPAAVAGSMGLGHSVYHHDMQQQVVNGRNMLLVSYWDAGQIQLDISNPAAPVYVGSSTFPSPDLAGFEVSEGNSHQSYWSNDGRYVLSSDEDFSPTRTQCTTGPASNATEVSCGEFGWTVPLQTAHPNGVEGTTVWGGSGCLEDVNGNGTSDRAEIPPASVTGAKIIVFSRGTCFFSIKTESGQLAGYDVVAIGQSHAGARNGLVPDGYICGGQGHSYTITKPAICIGHRTMHELFASTPHYSGPDIGPGGDLPAIGTLGGRLSAKGGVFDGWGYLRLHDGTDPDLREIDAYAVPEALDPAYASGFGNLTIHEVKTDPRRGKNLAYASWYDAGLRVLSFGPSGLQEVGHYIAEGGNDFWGVYPVCAGQCLLNDRDQGRGRANEKRPLLLMSDRDSGLWIFRYTGKE